MNSDDEEYYDSLSLVCYEKLTEHGFALPLYKRSETANAVHIAVPSCVADPDAVIAGFQLYNEEASVPIDLENGPSGVSPGTNWLDVFIWADAVHVGTRSQIWESIADVREELEQSAPLSLLAVADGARAPDVGSIAATAYGWLAANWGDAIAARWQVETYLKGLVLRGLRRKLDSESEEYFEYALHGVALLRRSATIELRLPDRIWRSTPVSMKDLPDFTAASSAFGLEVEILPPEGDTSPVQAELPTVLLMRVRKGRGKTQTQIPFGAVDEYFGNNLVVHNASSGKRRSLTLSTSDGGRRNTMKLQLPEMAEINDPVVRFERGANAVTYSVHDASSPEGKIIADSLEEGLQDGSTRRTQGKATWWRTK